MEEKIAELCETMVQLLTLLRKEEKITQEEYEKHTELKIKLLAKIPV